MPKIYRDKNVYEAAMERYDIIYKNFDHIYFSVSGGKDSSIMLQLAADAAGPGKKSQSSTLIWRPSTRQPSTTWTSLYVVRRMWWTPGTG